MSEAFQSNANGASFDEIKSVCQESLRFLCKKFLWVNQPPAMQVWSKMHDDLEMFLLKPARRKAILLPRGHLKSSVVTVAKSIQLLLANPDCRILIASQIWDTARDFLRSIKGYFETSNLQHIYGTFTSNRWAEDAITIRQRTNRGLKEPSIQTTGVEAERTGGHYDYIFADDLTGITNVGTHEQREKTKRFRRSLIDLLEPGGIVYEVGTKWHMDDTFTEIMEKEKEYYDIVIRRVVENGRVIFPEKFAKKFDPITKCWSQADDTCMDYINALRASKTLSEFNAQYMNNPIDEETQSFKRDYFRYWSSRPENLHIVCTLDLAVSQKNESDYTAIVMTGMDSNHNMYVLDYVRGRWKPSDTISVFFQLYDRWKPDLLGIEVEGFQRTFRYTIQDEMKKRNVFFPITEIVQTRQSNSKNMRISAMEPKYRAKEIVHAEWMANKDLEHELLEFPKGRHDDLIDAVSMAMPLLKPGAGENKIKKMQVGSFAWAHKIGSDQLRGPNNFFHYG